MPNYSDRRRVNQDKSLKKIAYSLGICKTCGNRTQKVEGDVHVHARYPMGHPANPRKATAKEIKERANKDFENQIVIVREGKGKK